MSKNWCFCELLAEVNFWSKFKKAKGPQDPCAVWVKMLPLAQMSMVLYCVQLSLNGNSLINSLQLMFQPAIYSSVALFPGSWDQLWPRIWSKRSAGNQKISAVFDKSLLTNEQGTQLISDRIWKHLKERNLIYLKDSEDLLIGEIGVKDFVWSAFRWFWSAFRRLSDLWSFPRHAGGLGWSG